MIFRRITKLNDWLFCISCAELLAFACHPGLLSQPEVNGLVQLCWRVANASYKG